MTFNDDASESLDAICQGLIQQGKYLKAIDIYALRRPSNRSDLSQKIIDTLRQATKAAISHDYFKAFCLHCELLSLDGGHLIGLKNFAVLLKRVGQYSSAQYFISKCLELFPDDSDALNISGSILADLGQNDKAILAFRKSLEINPASAQANNNLANQYHLSAKIDLAFVHSSCAVAYEPSTAELWLDHLTHLRRVCDFERISSINWWNVVNQIPSDCLSSSFLQLLTIAQTHEEVQLLARVLRRWGDRQLQQAEEQPIESFVKPPLLQGQPLRIGLISADFRDHSVARFLWPLFEHLDRTKLSLYCYSIFRQDDSWRQRFQINCAGFRDVGDLSSQQLIAAIRRDQIHVLIDLTGFTNGSRTGALAWRAAPVQISWLGFPGSSGLKTMDYLFVDQYLKPTDFALLSEKTLETKGSTVCFAELDEVPITRVIPEVKRGQITFGSLNNSYKMTQDTILRWAAVLRELPDSQFLFVRKEFQSHFLRANIQREFAKAGISSQRLHFYDNSLDGRHYLDCYNEIDISLDTYPVTGGATTTDALWMGVPVVCLEGPHVHQRVCSSILHHAGHPEWIAHSDDDFIRIALELASNQSLRVDLRQSLRNEVKSSLLCDSKRFAADFGDCMMTLMEDLQ